MGDLLLLDLALEYQKTLECNGIAHCFKGYLFEGKLVKLGHARDLQKLKYELTPIYHMGFKFPFSSNYCIFGFFTSQPISFFWDHIIFNNIRLHNNTFKYVNPIIIGLNSTFADFFLTIDNYDNLPAYIRQGPNIIANLERLSTDAFSGFYESWTRSDFNKNPLLLDNVIYQYHENLTCNSSSIVFRNKIFYGESFTSYMFKKDLLKQAISNSDIFNFQKEFEKEILEGGKRLRNISYIKI